MNRREVLKSFATATAGMSAIAPKVLEIKDSDIVVVLKTSRRLSPEQGANIRDEWEKVCAGRCRIPIIVIDQDADISVVRREDV